ncbi:hypothetical protein HELRODRAFT_175029 [Helobdella robusta]|uniref:Uncharacterized protein n=1 Tax=Helobdella robusta TaxID=6412 RepID=T1F8R0_HELRO|nr:hypothetical protein HELRODRAFT_175029 [Helobdella robusta]ESO01005.1 hypothetical protein HELRODRAFT_175029 [Helobdella robusta]
MDPSTSPSPMTTLPNFPALTNAVFGGFGQPTNNYIGFLLVLGPVVVIIMVIILSAVVGCVCIRRKRKNDEINHGYTKPVRERSGSTSNYAEIAGLDATIEPQAASTQQFNRLTYSSPRFNAQIEKNTYVCLNFSEHSKEKLEEQNDLENTANEFKIDNVNAIKNQNRSYENVVMCDESVYEKINTAILNNSNNAYTTLKIEK